MTQRSRWMTDGGEALKDEKLTSDHQPSGSTGAATADRESYVPFFRPSLTEAEIGEVVNCLRSGWLTTGPFVKRFEEAFCNHTGAAHAIALNSCTAALHLAVEALGLRQGQAVLVPTMTFAATAEVVRYQHAIPILVDCDPATGHMNLADASRKLALLRAGRLGPTRKMCLEPVGIMPVHVGGAMMDVADVSDFAEEHGLWIVEDAAHSFPAAWRPGPTRAWQRCGEGTAAVTCFSFYANKTMTTGEGGMAVTNDATLASRMRMMSLHGLSHDAWKRYARGGSWDYRILSAGYKYNLTDLAAAIGVHQVERAEQMRQAREAIARRYFRAFADLGEVDLPADPSDRVHAWHLFPVRLRLDRLTIDRNEFVQRLSERGIGSGVHWRPLHLHPYYEALGWTAELLPLATEEWIRRLSLPLFPDLTNDQVDRVVHAVRDVCQRFRRGARGPRATGRRRRPGLEPNFDAVTGEPPIPSAAPFADQIGPGSRRNRLSHSKSAR